MKKLLFICLFPITVFSQITDADFDKSEIATNLDTPWEILWGPDSKIWFTERKGTVKRVDPNTKTVETLLTITDVVENSETGLLGMAIHPDFNTSKPWVYLVYTYTKNGATNGTSTVTNIVEKLVRYTYQNNTLTSPTIILDNIYGNTTHVGSRLLFLPDKTLLMTTGDAQNRPLSQSTTSVNGKVLRMKDDGTAPTDNPINGSLVYSWGHRNPQGLAYGNNKIYEAEHGDAIDDEINIIEPNRNYGWPTVQGPCNTTTEQTFCTQNNVVEPLWSSGSNTEAIAGLDYYPANGPVTVLQNSLLLVSLKFTNTTGLGRDFRIYKLNSNGDAYLSQTVLLNNMYGRMRDICVSPAGDIYISTSNQDGRGTPATGDDKIIKLKYNKVTATDDSQLENFTSYPNPVNDILNINFVDGTKLTLTNILGGYEFEFTVSNSKINIENLKSGVYIIKDASNKILNKIIKL